MMGPPESGRLDDRQGSRRRSRAPWTDDPPPPPHQQHSPSTQKELTLDPLTPFVISEANAPLFQSVLTNWSVQACLDCRMVLAAPGVFTLPEGSVLQGGRRLVIEAAVEGVTIQPLTVWSIYNASLVLRRLTVDGDNKVFPRAGFLYIRGGEVEAYDTTFRHHAGLNCAGVACVMGPSSFLASGCTFEHNSCLDVLGGGAITMDGSSTDSEPPWVALDRCTFYENSCNGGGGAVKAYGRGSISITSSIFTGQQAQGFGGAFFASCAYMEKPDYTGHSADVYPYSQADLSVTIRGCQFHRNQVVRRTSVWGGGAIYSNANLTLSDSLFFDNQVPPHIGVVEADMAIGGGALWNDGILRGTNLHFEKNEGARVGGAALLANGPTTLSGCTFVNNKAGNQGGALFVNASTHTVVPPPTAPPATAAPPPGVFVKDCAFQGNSITGFPAPYYKFSYSLGGCTLAVWGRLLVHNSSFVDDVGPPCEANGTMALVEGQGVLQLAFCSFSTHSGPGGRRRDGLRPGDLHLSSPAASARCLGAYAWSNAAGKTALAAAAAQAQCFIGPAGGEPWSTPALLLILGLPLGLALYLLLFAGPLAARQRSRDLRWDDGGADGDWADSEEDEDGGGDTEQGEPGAAHRKEAHSIQSSGYDPAATFPLPPSGSATMWRFLRGSRRRRASQQGQQQESEGREKQQGEGRQPPSQQQQGTGAHPRLDAGGAAAVGKRAGPSSLPLQQEDGGKGKGKQGGGGGGNGDDEGSEEEEEEEEEEDMLDWRETRAYRLSLGAELRDPTKPGELGANHLEPFTLEGRGKNMFQVTDPQPLTHSRFGRLYFARNTGVGGAAGPCLMLIYNRFKHEAATLVTEKELLHTGSSSTCPFLLRHLDDFFHDKLGYYVALTPGCRETLYHRLRRAVQAPADPAHALDFPTCVRYLHEILQGLGALRDLRMVHGRLSLSAVLLTDDDHVRLWNYGMSPSASIRRPDKPTVYSAPEVWDMLRMNPTPVSSMDSWSAGVVGYMLAARALAVALPPCAARYRKETYLSYLGEYLERERKRQASYYDEVEAGEGAGLGMGTAEPYFPSLPSVDPAFREEDRRDHGGALVAVLSRLLDVNPNRRLPLEAAELELRQIAQRAVLLARSGSGGGGGGGGGARGGGGGAALTEGPRTRVVVDGESAAGGGSSS